MENILHHQGEPFAKIYIQLRLTLVPSSSESAGNPEMSPCDSDLVSEVLLSCSLWKGRGLVIFACPPEHL